MIRPEQKKTDREKEDRRVEYYHARTTVRDTRTGSAAAETEVLVPLLDDAAPTDDEPETVSASICTCDCCCSCCEERGGLGKLSVIRTAEESTEAQRSTRK